MPVLTLGAAVARARNIEHGTIDPVPGPFTQALLIASLGTEENRCGEAFILEGAGPSAGDIDLRTSEQLRGVGAEGVAGNCTWKGIDQPTAGRIQYKIERVHHLPHDPDSLQPVEWRVKNLVHACPHRWVLHPSAQVACGIEAQSRLGLRHSSDPVGKGRMNYKIAVRRPVFRKLRIVVTARAETVAENHEPLRRGALRPATDEWQD